MDASDLVGAACLPTDGQANPSDIAQALAKGARQGGVRIIEDCRGHRLSHARTAGSRGVVTDLGDIACEVVALCAGLWSSALGRLAGVRVPLCPVQHQYLITERIEGVTPGLPTLRDPDRLIYFKEEVGGLVMGGYEPDPKPWAADGIPEDFHFTLLDPDWDHFEQLMGPALARVPALERAGIKQLINGPESFTPDGNFILGEAPELRGFYVGAGFNAFGIAAGGGAGKALAEWIAAGEPPMDLWPVDIRRFGSPHGDDGCGPRAHPRALRQALHARLAGRGARAAAARSAARRSMTGCKPPVPSSGRRTASSAPTGSPAAGLDEPRDVYSFGRPNWFEAVGRGAPGLPRAGRPVRCQPRSPSSCWSAATPSAALVLDLRQRRRPAAGPRRLHPDAEREAAASNATSRSRGSPTTLTTS